MIFLALLPILWLVFALSVLKLPAHIACPAALLTAAVTAFFGWSFPLPEIFCAAGEGIRLALWPIGLVIIAALFTYHLVEETGAMRDIKRMLQSVSRDPRILTLLIGFGFSNLMEGMAGFGTAVAIPASMLAALGVSPIRAVVGTLVVNSTPTAFGSVGVGTATLAAVTGLSPVSLSANIAALQFLHTFLIPFFLLWICAPEDSSNAQHPFRGILPLIVCASLSNALPVFLSARFLGPELPDLLGAFFSMLTIVLLARRKRETPATKNTPKNTPALFPEQMLRAWTPFLLIFLFLLAGKPFCAALGAFNTPGIWIFLAAFAGGFIQGASFKKMLCLLGKTVCKYVRTLITLCAVLAMARIMTASGMISLLAAALVACTGQFYPFFAPFIGALGGFVTGSGTSSAVLFGALQAQSAEALGVSPYTLTAANMFGAGIGKMVCPQSIAIGAGAIGAAGSESKILLSVFRYFCLFLLAAGILVYSFV